jgi:hypothetical protein
MCVFRVNGAKMRDESTWSLEPPKPENTIVRSAERACAAGAVHAVTPANTPVSNAINATIP